MAQMFTISDSESEPSEEVGETEKDQSSAGKGMTGGPIGHALTVPEMRLAGEGRLRMNSESQAQELQGRGPGVEGVPTDGASFRGRSQSAPPALWAAKRYGRQLRRMSDEFDTWLDKGEMRRVKSAGAAKQMTKSPSWWAYLFSHKETETEPTVIVPLLNHGHQSTEKGMFPMPIKPLELKLGEKKRGTEDGLRKGEMGLPVLSCY
uniref:BCL2 associated agonist of cell death b n=1 Tax=Oncorhynchus tshawytscha TaxID=74940 RepID=A0A8C8GG62_ONCTS